MILGQPSSQTHTINKLTTVIGGKQLQNYNTPKQAQTIHHKVSIYNKAILRYTQIHIKAPG